MADVAIGEAVHFGLASVLPYAGVGPAALSAALGFEVVSAPVESAGDGVTLWGTGPNQWLAHTSVAAPDWAEALGKTLSGVAAVVDQSGAYAGLSISGSDARRLLQKGLPIDLSPQVFVPGAVAVSVIAHIGVIIRQIDETSFDVSVFRSLGESFHHWLTTAAATL